MKSLYRWIVYVSLPLLALYLLRQGFLEVPTIRSPLALALSAIPLMGTFLGTVLAWWRILARSGFESRFTECLASMGLSIFGKYIPGKVWQLLGRAAYVGARRGYPLGMLSTASLNEQLIALWAGLLLGTIGLFGAGGLRAYGWLALASWTGLSLLVFSPWAHRSAEALSRAVLRRDIHIPPLSLGTTMAILPWSLGYWLAVALAFYLLAGALSARPVPLLVGLGFPLAGSLGVMAAIAPGGLGVREGILVGYLSLLGIPIVEATTIAVASRAWFLIGESAFFVSGLVADRRLNRRSPEPAPADTETSGRPRAGLEPPEDRPMDRGAGQAR